MVEVWTDPIGASVCLLRIRECAHRKNNSGGAANRRPVCGLALAQCTFEDAIQVTSQRLD